MWWVTSAAPGQGTGARIIETRKTAPGLRVLDKWAVLIGGGANHRMGLFDMVMIKNNHVDAAGGISPAVRACTVRMPSKHFTLACISSDVHGLRVRCLGCDMHTTGCGGRLHGVGRSH